MQNENKKEKILISAAKIFADIGFEKATVDSIAEGANVAKGTVYYHFESKEQIFESLINTGKDRFIEIIESEISKSDDILEKIKILIETEHQFVIKYKDFFMIYMSELLKKDFKFEVLEDLLSKGKEKNIFRKDLDIENSSNIIFWMIAINAIKDNKESPVELVLKGLLI